MNINILSFIFTLTLSSCVLAEEFVVTQKNNVISPKSSRNKLKEEIGSVAKDAFHSTRSLIGSIGKMTLSASDLIESSKLKFNYFDTSLQKKIGLLQVSISAIQKKISLSLERLLDNQAPFKKASRKELFESHSIMNNVLTSLNQSKIKLKSVRFQFAQSMRLPAFKKNITQEQKDIILKKQIERKEHCLVGMKKNIEDIVQKTEQLVVSLKNDSCLKQL